LKWIWQNKEWLFSGVGVSFILAFAGLAYRAIHRRKIPAALAASPVRSAEPTRFTKPTPREIKTQIAALPPFQARAASEAYKGLKVRWQTQFLYVDEDRDSNGGGHKNGRKRGKKQKTTEWLVALRYDDPSERYASEVIFCHGVNLEAHPQLKFLHAHAAIVVSGTIKSVGSGVQLIDVGLEFP